MSTQNSGPELGSAGSCGALDCFTKLRSASSACSKRSSATPRLKGPQAKMRFSSGQRENQKLRHSNMAKRARWGDNASASVPGTSHGQSHTRWDGAGSKLTAPPSTHAKTARGPGPTPGSVVSTAPFPIRTGVLVSKTDLLPQRRGSVPSTWLCGLTRRGRDGLLHRIHPRQPLMGPGGHCALRH